MRLVPRSLFNAAFCFILLFTTVPAQEIVTEPIRQFGIGSLQVIAHASDGDTVCLGGWGGGAYLYSLQSASILRMLHGHTGPITCVAFSSDRARVLTGSSDGTARLWSALSGRLMHVMDSSVDDCINAVTFSPDGTHALVGSTNDNLTSSTEDDSPDWFRDGKLQLWDVATGDLIRTYPNVEAGIDAIDFSPDGSRILAAATKWGVPGNGVYMGHGDRWTIQVLATHFMHRVVSVAWSPDGSRVLTGSIDGLARLWNVTTGELLFSLGIYSGSSGNEVHSVSFSPDGTRILTNTEHVGAWLWDAATGAPLLDLSTYVSFTPDGLHLISDPDSADKNFRRWDAATGELVKTYPYFVPDHTDGINAAAFSPDGALVLTGSSDTTAKLWNPATGELIRTLSGHTGAVTDVAFSPDGSTILTGSRDATARLWNVATGDLMQIYGVSGGSSGIASLAYSPDGAFILAGANFETYEEPWLIGKAFLLEAESGELVQTFSCDSRWLYSLAFSSDGKFILAGTGIPWVGPDSDGAVFMWDAVSGELIRTYRAYWQNFYSVAFSTDSRRVLAGTARFGKPFGSYGSAFLWDASDGELLRNFSLNDGWVFSLKFSFDGQFIVTGESSADSLNEDLAFLWNAETGEHIRTLRGHTNDIFSVAFSLDSRYILTGSADRTARLWDSGILPPPAAVPAAAWRRY